jgi:hypothetical protein
MTLLVSNTPLTAAETNITANILDASAGPHALAFSAFKQVLTIVNGDVVPITVNLLGDGVTTFDCPTIGAVDTSGGKDIVVAAGDTVTVFTAEYGGWMGAEGNNTVVTITSATSLSSIYLSNY